MGRLHERDQHKPTEAYYVAMERYLRGARRFTLDDVDVPVDDRTYARPTPKTPTLEDYDRGR